MIEPKFDYHSLRAKKARLTVGYNSTWRLIFRLLILMLLLFGSALLINNHQLGWLAIAIAPLFHLFDRYWLAELHRLDPDNKTNGVESVLSSSVLGRLSQNPTPKQLAVIVAETSSGLFILGRFGISAGMIQEISANDPQQTKQIWQDAINIYQKIKSPTMSGGILALALIKNFPKYKSILAHLQLDYADLEQGVIWHDRLYDKIDQSKQFIKTGGVARDWAFGYVPLLQRFGRPINKSVATNQYLMSQDLDYYQQPLKRAIDILNSGNKSLALIGDQGIPKADLINLLAAKLLIDFKNVPTSIKFNQIFEVDASSLVAQAENDTILEQIIVQLVNEAHQAKNIILYFNHAELFFESGTGSVDLSKILLPAIEAGVVKIILSFDKQQLIKLSQKQANLVANLQKINLIEPDQKQTMLILKDKIFELEAKLGVIFMYQTLKQAYQLGERYMHDLKMPYQAISLLEQAANYAEGKVVRFNAINQVIENNMNIKLTALNSPERKQILLDLEQLISQKLIGQQRAVATVSNALRRAGSGVRNQNRPIGSFIFLGSTGVGKTQLAKTLAEVYFEGEKNLIRLDLNEFVTDNSVDRLIATAADNPYSLTAQVIKNPFAVILLDEIEKAHPTVLATLLQLLDEGILRDAENNQVNFRDTIIIATSNAGSDKVNQFLTDNEDASVAERQFVDYLIKNNYFKPEFLNRFDELIIFEPLTKDDLTKIVDLLITEVNHNLSDQKVTIKLTDDAKQILIERGYDPELGARPMRRVVQRTVENLVAKKIIADDLNSDKTITISAEDLA